MLKNSSLYRFIKLFQILTASGIFLLALGCSDDKNPNSVNRGANLGNGGDGGNSKPIKGLGANVHGYTLMGLLAVKQSVRALDIVVDHLNGKDDALQKSCQSFNGANPVKGAKPALIALDSNCQRTTAEEKYNLTFVSGGYGGSELKTITSSGNTFNYLLTVTDNKKNETTTKIDFTLVDDNIEITHVNGDTFSFSYSGTYSHLKNLGTSRKSKNEKEAKSIDLTLDAEIGASGVIDYKNKTLTLTSLIVKNATRKHTHKPDFEMTVSEMILAPVETDSTNAVKANANTGSLICDIPMGQFSGTQKISGYRETFTPGVLIANNGSQKVNLTWLISNNSLSLTCQKKGLGYLNELSEKVMTKISADNL